MARASRNVLLTLLGAGVVGGVAWLGTGGTSSDCQARYPDRDACEAVSGAGQCAIDPATNQWRAMSCRSSYVPRSYSHYWGGWGSRSSASPRSTARSGSPGRVDAAPPTSGRRGVSPPATGRSGATSPGGSSRGGFGSVGASRSGSS